MDEYEFDLIILSREGIVFQDKVASITSYNASGRFDILAQHANFISLITTEIIVTKKDRSQTKYQISNALIKVVENKVKIYLGIDWFTNSNRKSIYA
jgi:F0F1-type ATP synthase epsilon subunit